MSFDVSWSGGGDRVHVRDATFGFEGDYVTGPAQISFVAANDKTGVTYSSNPNGQYNPTVEQFGAGEPAVGSEKNGTFFG